MHEDGNKEGPEKIQHRDVDYLQDERRGAEQAEPEPVDRRPLMNGLRPEDDDYAGKPGQRHSYLRRDPERFVRFHELFRRQALSAFISSALNFSLAAAMFSSRCATDEVPGIGNMTGERWSSQAIAT